MLKFHAKQLNLERFDLRKTFKNYQKLFLKMCVAELLYNTCISITKRVVRTCQAFLRQIYAGHHISNFLK